jgi:hypothetical protein
MNALHAHPTVRRNDGNSQREGETFYMADSMNRRAIRILLLAVVVIVVAVGLSAPAAAVPGVAWTVSVSATAIASARGVSADSTGVYVVGDAQDSSGYPDVIVRKYDYDG